MVVHIFLIKDKNQNWILILTEGIYNFTIRVFHIKDVLPHDRYTTNFSWKKLYRSVNRKKCGRSRFYAIL